MILIFPYYFKKYFKSSSDVSGNSSFVTNSLVPFLHEIIKCFLYCRNFCFLILVDNHVFWMSSSDIFYFGSLDNLLLVQFFLLLSHYPENLFLLFFVCCYSSFCFCSLQITLLDFLPLLFWSLHSLSLLFLFLLLSHFLHFLLPHLLLFLTWLPSFYFLMHLTKSQKPLYFYHHLSFPLLFVLQFYLAVVLFLIYLIFSLAFDHIYLLWFYFLVTIA